MAPPPKYQPLRPRPELRSAAPLPSKPRRVKGGVRAPISDASTTGSWIAQRWLRLLEQVAEGQRLIEGQEYAREGQTKRWSTSVGKAEASIQGRAFRPYTTSLAIPTFTPEQWDNAVNSMSEGAMYSAKLLAGELPPNIEDVFSSLGVKLVPTLPGDVIPKCSCDPSSAPVAQDTGLSMSQVSKQVTEQAGKTELSPTGEVTHVGRWCKHACCLAYLLAARFTEDPFLIFTLRGLDTHDLLERLRQRRAVVGAALGSTPIYQQRVSGVSDMQTPKLEETLNSFWEMGNSVKELDMPMTKPEVSQPLLRRLGQSPWTGQAKFPLVGLLASCYETISEKALQETPPPDALA